MTEEVQEPGDEWADLEALWSADGRPEELHIQRLTQRMRGRAARRRWWRVIEVVLPLSVVLFTVGLAFERQESLWWIAAFYATLTFGVACAFWILNRHTESLGSFGSPAVVIAAARNELEIRRRGLRFGWLLMGLHSVFFVVWFAIAQPDGYLRNCLTLAAWLAPFVVATTILQGRVAREAMELGRLEKELDLESDQGLPSALGQ